MKILRKLFRYFRPYLGHIILYVLLGFVVVGLGMIMPKVQKIIFDNLFSSVPYDFFGMALSGSALLVGVAIAMIGQSLLRQSMHYFRIILNENTAQQAVNAMRADLFDCMINQSQSFMRSQNTGNLMTVINGDPETVKNFFIGTVPQMFEVVVAFIFAAVMLCTEIHPYMFLCAVVPMPLVAFLSAKARKRIRPRMQDIRDYSADLSRRAQENINGIRVVKAFNNEELERRVFDKHNDQIIGAHFAYLKEYVHSYLPMDLCASLPYCLVNIVGALLIFGDQLSIGGLVATGGYLSYVTQLFACVPGWISATQQANTSAAKIMELMECGNELADKPDMPQISAHGDLKLEHVNMVFDGHTVLSDVCIDLPLGKQLGVMGKTGSGKTILANVMMRFYDPTSGKVTLDGMNEKDMRLGDVRRAFSPVMQDVFLFSETVEKNIAFYDETASHERVEWAAQTAQAADFINNLQEGYQTIIGERGVGLSGGQKQRISIARALLKNAPIIILDDASSALDMETEQALAESMRRELQGHTVVTIAHRVSSVKDCDEIIYLENGVIVERGTHEELLGLKGRYYEIYKEQYGELTSAIEGVE